MLTNQIRNDIDRLWDLILRDGITNPFTVIEQISYLLFARMLDIQEQIAERKAEHTGGQFYSLFPSDDDGQLLRWKNFKNLTGTDLHEHLKFKVYPYFSELSRQGVQGRESGEAAALGSISEHMQDADLEVQDTKLLVNALEMVENLPLTQADLKGDIYECLLSKLTTAGIHGQFCTPRHIIDAMVEMVDPKPTDVVCDPACGTAGFLTRTMEYLSRTYSSKAGTWLDEEGNTVYSGDLLEPYSQHINSQMFWGFDIDSNMLRLASMNMMLHGVSGANIHYSDTLSQKAKKVFPEQEQNFFDVILCSPPFGGNLDEDTINSDLLGMVKTKRIELLFLAHTLRSLKNNGRAAVIVPNGVLFGSSRAHLQLRKELIEKNRLDGVVSLPGGVFHPYTGIATTILVFTKGGSTDQVWFYDLQTNGYSSDYKRTPYKDGNDLPGAVAQWKQYKELLEAGAPLEKINQVFGDKTQKAFLVDAKDIIVNKFDLSINRYKEVTYERETYEKPKVILQQLMVLENEIMDALKALDEML